MTAVFSVTCKYIPYIYIYIFMFTHTHTHTHWYMHIYIYIYIYIYNWNLNYGKCNLFLIENYCNKYRRESMIEKGNWALFLIIWIFLCTVRDTVTIILDGKNLLNVKIYTFFDSRSLYYVREMWIFVEIIILKLIKWMFDNNLIPYY